MITKPEKYTEEYVTKELENMIAELYENKDIIVLGELFEVRDYSPQRFSEWADKFVKNDEISESIKKIKSILETRINIGGLKGKLNPTMTIFNLKNNYGWADRNETEITNPDGSLSPYRTLSDEELRALAKKAQGN